MVTYSDVIRVGRERLGMTQQAFADAAGVTRTAVQQWEKGVTAPTRKNQPAVAKLLGITPAELMNPTDDVLALVGRLKEGGEASSGALPGPASAPSIQAALPVVLEAMRACPNREELRTLLTLLIDIDAEPYRRRLLELLDTQSLPRPPAQTRRREDAAQEESTNATSLVGHTTGSR